jgi:hypothetical protein
MQTIANIRLFDGFKDACNFVDQGWITATSPTPIQQ